MEKRQHFSVWLFVLVFAGALLLAGNVPALAQERSYVYDHIDVTVDVQSDGTLIVIFFFVGMYLEKRNPSDKPSNGSSHRGGGGFGGGSGFGGGGGGGGGGGSGGGGAG